MRYAGYWRAPHGVLQPVLAADGYRFYDAANHYFRTVATFETPDDRYTWLNALLVIGVGARTPKGVSYDFFELL